MEIEFWRDKRRNEQGDQLQQTTNKDHCRLLDNQSIWKDFNMREKSEEEKNN